MRATDPQSLAADHHPAVWRHLPPGPQSLGGGRDDHGARALSTADLPPLLRRNRRGHGLDDAAVDDDVHQLAVEAKGDGLSGKMVCDLHLLAAEPDVAVPVDDAIDLDHQSGLRLIDQGGSDRLRSGDASAPLYQCLQVGRSELGDAVRARSPSMKRPEP
ncbi:hypothetical protein [Streptomyces sp. NBC_00557]|uniref:hypothetical protein n=1 Tax=Streptomyces sp. NBC_00557 TaxID=2975776 RepID=UPI002E80E9DA|nr:hypothetical protein [Streptomyces sp. NBC_00557]WUC32753.1 hypothetical protein OG956_00170 [Streptomyces sp. NBC_00557]